MTRIFEYPLETLPSSVSQSLYTKYTLFFIADEHLTSYSPFWVRARVSKNAVFGLNLLPDFWTHQHRL